MFHLLSTSGTTPLMSIWSGWVLSTRRHTTDSPTRQGKARQHGATKEEGKATKLYTTSPHLTLSAIFNGPKHYLYPQCLCPLYINWNCGWGHWTQIHTHSPLV